MVELEGLYQGLVVIGPIGEGILLPAIGRRQRPDLAQQVELLGRASGRTLLVKYVRPFVHLAGPGVQLRNPGLQALVDPVLVRVVLLELREPLGE